jgi:hypothetical protein
VTPYSFEFKLDRAIQHVKELGAVFDRWSKTNPYVGTVDYDPETRSNTLSVEVRTEPFTRLSQIIGDIAHNFRGVLDHMALALAEANYGGRVPAEVERKSQFPICTERDYFRNARTRQIEYVAARPQATIQSLQPYKWRDARQRHPLNVLRDLSDFDKHRRLPVVAGYSEVTDIAPSGRITDLYVSPSGLLKGKTPVLSFRSVDPSEVQVEYTLTLDIAFDEGAPATAANRPVRAVLDEIGGFLAEKVIDRLQPYL